MSSLQFLEAQIDEHTAVLRILKDSIAEPFSKLVETCIKSLQADGKIFLFGNGGSASDAQHIAAELVVRYKKKRKALGAIALNTDTSTLTACANDLSYDEVFARQIEALARPGDVVIAISTSGRSPNVLKAVRTAREIGVETIGLTGGDGGDMVALCDTTIIVPSSVTARIQEMHILIGHALCDLIEQATN